MDEVKTTGIDQKKLRPKIEKVRNKIKSNPIVQNIFKEHNLSIDDQTIKSINTEKKD